MDLPGLAALALIAAEWLALGWLSGVAFPGQPSTVASWALRLLVGAVLVGVTQLGLALVGVGFSSIAVALAVAATAAGAVGRAGSGRRAVSVDKITRTGRRERVGWLLLGAVLVAAGLRSLLVPEAGWDAYSHWGLRAQAFTLAGTIVDAHSEHEYYPPLAPLLEAWLYLHRRGAISIDLAKAIWALVGSAFAVCLGWHLKLSLRRPWLAPYFALGIVLGTTALLEGFWTGQADLALTACLCLAALAAWQWQRSPDRAWLVQAGVFAAAAALAKFEGAPRVGVLVVALVIGAAMARRRPPLAAAVSLTVGAAAAWLLWTSFQLGHGIAPNAEHLGGFDPLALGGVALALLAVFGGIRTGGGVAVAVLAWAVAGRALFRTPLRPLSLIVLGQLIATLLAFLLSATAPEVEVRTSATRLFEQWLPLALFVAAVGLDEVHL